MVLWLLTFCSILSISVIIERLFVFGIIKRKIKKLNRDLLPKLKKNKINDSIDICEKNKSLVGDMFAQAIDKKGQTKDKLEELVHRKGIALTLQLENKLSILATLGNITPFIGLFGTVLGIIKTFRGLSLAQTYAAGMVASGIAEALLNTAAGLFVAIPAVIAFNYFTRQTYGILRGLEITSSEVIELLTGGNGPSSTSNKTPKN